MKKGYRFNSSIRYARFALQNATFALDSYTGKTLSKEVYNSLPKQSNGTNTGSTTLINGDDPVSDDNPYNLVPKGNRRLTSIKKSADTQTKHPINKRGLSLNVGTSK